MTTLYRNYRPASFDQVIGQDAAVAELQALLASKDFPHAVILVGGRGIGKTTLARIVAGQLGCDPMDIYELDAASNNGVDTIRDMRADFETLPFMSPFKVYIFDEVHMLSKSAWNAFLKTLEEPPAHVKFIMATTEVHEIPETIISRSRVVRLQTPTTAMITQYVTTIAGSENFAVSADAAELIAVAANGSFRDSLVALQTCIASNAQDVDVVARLLGVPALALVRQWLVALHARDGAAALAVLDQLSAIGGSAEFFLDLAVARVRMALARRIGVATTITNPDDESLIATITSGTSPVSTVYLSHMIDAMRMIRQIPDGAVVLELVTYKITNK